MEKISRSLLFVPGDRPERFAKAAASGAHQVVLDLEDAVPTVAKAAARDAIDTWLGEGNLAAVRINAAESDWFEDDLRLIKNHPGATLMLAKAEADSLRKVADALPGHPVIALLETVAGYMQLRQMAATAGVNRMAFGSIDFAVESGIQDEADAMTAVRTQIVLESRYAGLLAPIDGVSVNLTDPELINRDALRTRQLGFGGKLCIHPKQVAAVNAAYRPTESEVDWAHRVIAADAQSRGGATRVDGKMVDKPVVEQARRILLEIER